MRPGQTRYGLRSLRKRNLTLNGIDLWGLHGVLIALLFVVMIDAPPTSHGVNVDRAPALHSKPMPGVLREDAMKILVTQDGTIYFRNGRVRAEDLPKEIEERVLNGAEKKVYLAIDAQAKYGFAEKVLDQIRLAGIREVSFLTDQPFISR